MAEMVGQAKGGDDEQRGNGSFLPGSAWLMMAACWEFGRP
jgi:hypothetical protein